MDGVALRESGVEAVAAAVRIAVELGRCLGHRLDRCREGRVGALVRGELHDVLQPELTLDVLDRLPGLVRGES